MKKRPTIEELVHEFETTDMGDKLAKLPVVHFDIDITRKPRPGFVFVEIPTNLLTIVRELLAIVPPPKRRRAKAA